jgi:putative transposase
MLTHKGIEFAGLFYNSPEMTELRRREGPELRVDIRVDEGDIGAIYVLWPGAPQPYVVPSLLSEYASGLSLWAHEICKKQKKERFPEDHDVSRLLEVKQYIQKRIEDDLSLKRRKSRKRSMRFTEGVGRNTAQVASSASGKPDTKAASQGKTDESVPERMWAGAQKYPVGGFEENESANEFLDFTARIKDGYLNE